MERFGKASNELYTQFLARNSLEIPTATIAIFSTLKYVISPTLEVFRGNWNAKYLSGFVVHSKSFEGLNGDFPIGFLIWKTNILSPNKKQEILTINTEVLDKKANPIGEKTFYNLPNNELLTTWIKRPKANKVEVIPLKNAIIPATSSKDLRGTKWSENALAWFNCAGNDLQQASKLTFLLSSGFGSGRGLFVNENNIEEVAITFAVRRLIDFNWLNDRDQFLQPTEPLTDAFKTDCLLWMLFNGSNLTASANDLEWNDRKWSIVNHFIPFTEEEVGANDRFESDFMVQYLRDKKLSAEAKLVLAEGRKLWSAYFQQTDVRSVREELKLNRPDVGWYQIRNALKKRNESGDFMPVSFKPFEEAYKALTEKLQPMVYELGFLKL